MKLEEGNTYLVRINGSVFKTSISDTIETCAGNFVLFGGSRRWVKAEYVECLGQIVETFIPNADLKKKPSGLVRGDCISSTGNDEIEISFKGE